MLYIAVHTEGEIVNCGKHKVDPDKVDHYHFTDKRFDSYLILHLNKV